MGLLKHVVLPLFAAAHGVMVWQLLQGTLGQAMMDAGVVTADYEFTTFEQHLLEAIGVTHAMLLFAAVLGIFWESAHFRGILAVMEFVFFAGLAYSDYIHGYPYQVGAGLATVAAVGILVHSLEPGLLTQDKTKKAKTK